MIQRAKGWSTLSNIDETIKLIEKNLSKDAEEINILDFGCGEGIYGHIIKACFPSKVKVFGCDVVKYAISEHIYDEYYVNKDFSAIELLDKITPIEGFDLILFNHVLEHLFLEEVQGLLAEAKNISDAIIVGLPNSKKGHVYKGTKPDDHKWGVSQFPAELQFQSVGKKCNLFLWNYQIEKC